MATVTPSSTNAVEVEMQQTNRTPSTYAHSIRDFALVSGSRCDTPASEFEYHERPQTPEVPTRARERVVSMTMVNLCFVYRCLASFSAMIAVYLLGLYYVLRTGLSIACLILGTLALMAVTTAVRAAPRVRVDDLIASQFPECPAGQHPRLSERFERVRTVVPVLLPVISIVLFIPMAAFELFGVLRVENPSTWAIIHTVSTVVCVMMLFGQAALLAYSGRELRDRKELLKLIEKGSPVFPNVAIV